MNDFVQNTYDLNIGEAYAGLIYDISNYVSASYSVESGTLRYGSGAVLGTDKDRQVRQPTAGDTAMRGIVIREHVREGQRTALADGDGNGETSYLSATETASVMTKGRIYVRVNEAVEAGDPVYVSITSDGTGDRFLGDFAKSNLSTEYLQVTDAVFFKGAAAGGLAVVELK